MTREDSTRVDEQTTPPPAGEQEGRHSPPSDTSAAYTEMQRAVRRRSLYWGLGAGAVMSGILLLCALLLFLLSRSV